MKNKVLYAIVSLLVLTGCGSMKNMSREDRAGVGAQIGAFVGWLFGGAVGNSIDDDIGGDIGAFVGTAVGGIAGAQIAANTGDEIRVRRGIRGIIHRLRMFSFPICRSKISYWKRTVSPATIRSMQVRPAVSPS